MLEKLLKVTKPLMTLGSLGRGSENQVALAILPYTRPWHGKELKSKSGNKSVFFFSLHDVDQT